MALIREEKNRKIELVPFMDVIFLLLTFFVVTSIITGQRLFAEFIEGIIPFRIPQLATTEERRSEIATNLLIQVYQEHNNTRYYILSDQYGPETGGSISGFGRNYMSWIRNGVIPRVLNTSLANEMRQSLLSRNDVRETLRLLKRLNPQARVTVRGARDVPFYYVIDVYNLCVDCTLSVNLSHGDAENIDQNIQWENE